jgi:enoyl-CoA hydratase
VLSDLEISGFDVTCSEGVARVVIRRPPVNAFDREMYRSLRRVFSAINEHPEVRVVTLTGSGRTFCAGHDLHDFVTWTADDADDALAVARTGFNALYDCRVPVIALVNGAALGTGLALTSLSDIRLASEDATFALPEIDVGVLGGSKHLMRIAGQGTTRLLTYTGRRLTAAEAKAEGFVTEVYPARELISAGEALAAEIASKNPDAIQLAKVALNRLEELSLKAGYEFECGLTSRLRTSPESQLGAAAFLRHEPMPSYGGGRLGTVR